jgi:hypothetical protein
MKSFGRVLRKSRRKLEGPGGNTSSGATTFGPPGSRPQRQTAQPQLLQTAAPTRGGRGAASQAAADMIELDDSGEEKEDVNTRLRRRAPAPSRMVDTIDLSD